MPDIAPFRATLARRSDTRWLRRPRCQRAGAGPRLLADDPTKALQAKMSRPDASPTSRGCRSCLRRVGRTKARLPLFWLNSIGPSPETCRPRRRRARERPLLAGIAARPEAARAGRHARTRDRRRCARLLAGDRGVWTNTRGQRGSVHKTANVRRRGSTRRPSEYSRKS